MTDASDDRPAPLAPLPSEEYIEQAHFFCHAGGADPP